MRPPKNIILKMSSVNYDRETHTYHLEGVRLAGITEMIKNQLFPDEYFGIKKEVLEAAAARGSMIHDLCESYDNFGDTSEEKQVQDYAKMRDRRPELAYELSEYVVSDEANFASPIDKVFRVGPKTFDLADIKTTSKLNMEYVSWQLSVYAYFFERMNPKAVVRKLYAIWLPQAKYGNARWVEVQRHSIDEVKKLLEAEVSNGKFLDVSIPRSERHKNVPTDVVKTEQPNVPADIAAMMDYVTATFNAYAEAEAQKKAMVEQVKTAMALHNVKSWVTDKFSFTQSADSVRKTLDIAKLKAKYPDIDFEDESLYKITNVKGGFTAKLK